MITLPSYQNDTMSPQPELSSLTDYLSYGIDGQPPDISLREYALWQLTPDLLVGITSLFFPSFVIHDDSVFLAERFSKSNYDAWKSGRYRNDVAAVERIMNHVHLVESFGDVFHKLSKHNVYYVGEVLVHTWKAALSHAFPERVFEVQGTRDEVGRDPDSGDFIITFWEVRSA